MGQNLGKLYNATTASGCFLDGLRMS